MSESNVDLKVTTDTGKSADVLAQHAQEISTVHGDENGLEPVLAAHHSTCPLCSEEVKPGDAIVSADGEKWVHVECATLNEWDIA